VLSTQYEIFWAEAWFELAHEACCYASQLGLVVVCPSLAANGRRLGGVVGKWAEAQSGVSRAEAQIRVVVNEACGDDDRVFGSRGAHRTVLRVRPYNCTVIDGYGSTVHHPSNLVSKSLTEMGRA
jgi:hypothetical protein